MLERDYVLECERPIAEKLDELFRRFPWVIQATLVRQGTPAYPRWKLVCVPDARMSQAQVDKVLPDLRAWVSHQVNAVTRLDVECEASYA